MNEVKKYMKLLQSDKYQAGPDSNNVTKGKGKKLWFAEDLMDELRKRGADARSAFGLAEAVIEAMHVEKAHLRERNETLHKSRYLETLESDHGIIVCETNSDQLYLTDLNDWHSTKFKHKSLIATCKAGGVPADEIDALIHNNMKTALFEYAPYNFNKLFSDGKDDFFNTFIPPAHFFNFETIEGDYPAINEFLAHLFINEADKEYVLDWMATSLYMKNHVFLLFPAAKGIGKNFFAERLLRPLYGQANYSSSRNDDIKSKFNSKVANNQLAMVDEFTLENEKDSDAIKHFTNDIMTVEEKFQARETKKISCNIVLFTNRLNKLQALDHDQRRFSLLPLTDLKLDLNKELMAKYETVNGLGEAMEKEIGAFYKYLRGRHVKRNMNINYVDAELIDQIKFESAKGYQAILMDLLEDMASGATSSVESFQIGLKDAGKTINVPTIIEYLKTLDICEFLGDGRPRSKRALVKKL